MLSQSVEYALRAMVRLAGLEPDVSERSEAVAERTMAPQDYLSKILRDLIVAELIQVKRRPNGGFALAREPGAISVLDIVNAVDGVRRPAAGPSGASPESVEQCLDGAKHTMERAFRRATLATLLRESRSGPSSRNTPGDAPGRRSGDDV